MKTRFTKKSAVLAIVAIAVLAAGVVYRLNNPYGQREENVQARALADQYNAVHAARRQAETAKSHWWFW